MVAILFGLCLIAFCICACLPGVLNWGDYIISSLKGSLPVIAAFAGIIAIFIGFADIQDKLEAKKEEKEAMKEAEEKSEKVD